MTLYEVTKKYSSGKGEATMWKTLDVVSRAIDESMDEEHKKHLIMKVFSIITEGHYNEDFAKDEVSKMYYTDKSGQTHMAPYWPEAAVKQLYERHRQEIPAYNFWDFYVTMNMVASDSWCLVKKWFPELEGDALNEKFVEMSVNWLKDEDWPTKTKVLDYMSVK